MRKPRVDLEQQLEKYRRELAEAREQQTATSEVLRVISGSPGDLRPVFEAILANAARLCEAEFSNLLLAEGDAFRHVASHGAPPKYLEARRRQPLIGVRPGAALDRLVKTKQVVHIADLVTERASDSGVLAKLAGARTLLAVPMLKDGELIGQIGIYRREVRPFTEKQIELVANFANQAVIAIENTRLLNELRGSLQQQTATSEVLQVISSSPGDLAPVFQVMLENATRVCDAKFGNMLLFEGGAFRTVALHNAPPAFAEARQRTPVLRPLPGTGLERVIATKQTVETADAQAEPAYHADPDRAAFLKLAGARTFVTVPMLKENELVGAIAIYRQEVRPFTPKQIELITNFAKQAVIAIENTRLLNELRESLQQQTATADVLKVISRSTFDLQIVLDTLVEFAARLCEAEMASMNRQFGAAYRQVASYGFSPEFKKFMETHPVELQRGTTVARAIQEKRPVQIPDVLADKDFDYKEGAKIGGVRTVAAVPMLKGDDLVGVIAIYRREVRPFTDKQIELVTTFADQAVIAIENVRLFEAEQQRTRELSEALEQQTATSEVLRVISSSPGELEPVFQAMLENATRLCEAGFANLLLGEGDQFRRVSLYNAPPAFAEYLRRTPMVRPHPDSALGRTALTKQVVHIIDTKTTPAYLERDPTTVAGAELAGHRTVLAVPMLKENALIGVIVVFRPEVRPFTEKHIELVSNFAKQAVIAIENTRLLNELRQRTDDLSEALEQQTATSEVLGIISSSPGDLGPVFQAMLANATKLCGAKFGILNLYDGEVFTRDAAYGVPAAFAYHQEPIRPHPRSGLAEVARTKRVVHIEDIRARAPYLERSPPVVQLAELGGARTLMLVPMLKESRLIGVIGIYRQEVRPFTEKQIELVQNFAAQSVIAIENTRLLNELRELLAQQTATADVLKVISRSVFDLQTVLQTLVEFGCTVVRCRQGDHHQEEGRCLLSGGSLRLFPRIHRVRQGHPHKARTWDSSGPSLAGRRDCSYPRCAERPGVQLGEGAGIGQLSHRSRRADASRGRPHRGTSLGTHAGAAVHRP